MKKSAGLAIIANNKLLLVHPTNAAWSGTYSIPKGLVEDGEKIMDAAIRETEEEIGILVMKDQIEPTEYHIDYKTKKGILYKRVYYFIVRFDFEFEIPVEFLQIDEVDWSGFLNLEEAKDKIFNRFLPILEHLKN